MHNDTHVALDSRLAAGEGVKRTNRTSAFL
jgi:hypothetical protein